MPLPVFNGVTTSVAHARAVTSAAGMKAAARRFSAFNVVKVNRCVWGRGGEWGGNASVQRFTSCRAVDVLRFGQNRRRAVEINPSQNVRCAAACCSNSLVHVCCHRCCEALWSLSGGRSADCVSAQSQQASTPAHQDRGCDCGALTHYRFPASSVAASCCSCS